MSDQKSLATATITYAELYAGLTRKYREGHLSRENYTLVCQQVETEWQDYLRVELQTEVLRMSRELIQRHPLRGFDAIHLASALCLNAGLDGDLTFIASDERLLRAAAAEHLAVLNVEAASSR